MVYLFWLHFKPKMQKITACPKYIYAYFISKYSIKESYLAPVGRRPGRSLTHFLRFKFQLTSFQLTTLRPPIRANPSTRGFAGGRNVGEWSERMRAKRTPTKEPSKARRLRSDNWVLGAVSRYREFKKIINTSLTLIQVSSIFINISSILSHWRVFP